MGSLKRGDYFGEQALINQDKRMASIIANEPGTECLTLDRVYIEILSIKENKYLFSILLGHLTTIWVQ